MEKIHHIYYFYIFVRNSSNFLLLTYKDCECGKNSKEGSFEREDPKNEGESFKNGA